MIKADIISGFLGAGKTTLISKLLKEALSNEKVVLIENEFGEIGIDGGFLKESGVVVNEMNSGCICCSLVGDFELSLKEVVDTYKPSRIIIEPSGVGKLSDVVKAVKTVDEITINNCFTVVDANKARIYSKNFKEFFNDQIEAAPCVILSRTQLINTEKLQESIDIIKNINPNAKIVTTNWDDLSALDLLETSNSNIEETIEKHHISLDHFMKRHGHCGKHKHHHEDEHECCGKHEHNHKHDEHECCGNHEHNHKHDEHECCGKHEHNHKHDEHECCGNHEHEHKHDDHECCGKHEHEHKHEHNHDEHSCSCNTHDHNHVHAENFFTSVGYQTINKYTMEQLNNILSNLEEDIIRAKGIVLDTDNNWIFFDYVPGEINIRKGTPAYTGLITVIGTKSMDEEKVMKAFGLK